MFFFFGHSQNITREKNPLLNSKFLFIHLPNSLCSHPHVTYSLTTSSLAIKYANVCAHFRFGRKKCVLFALVFAFIVSAISVAIPTGKSEGKCHKKNPTVFRLLAICVQKLIIDFVLQQVSVDVLQLL